VSDLIQQDHHEIRSWKQPDVESGFDINSRISAQDRVRVAAHEIKNPLSALLMNYQLAILNDEQPTPNDQDLMGLSLSHQYSLGLRIKGLIEFFFDSGYLLTGQIETDLELIDLKKIISDLVQQHVPIARAVGAELIFLGGPSVVGLFDRARVEQLTTNLICNAIKYGRSRPVLVGVSQVNSTEAAISIQDQGFGISEETVRRIFKFGQRGDEVGRVLEGQGLGLWMTQQIVMALGGFISVSSEKEVGSRFEVHLPIEEAKGSICGSQKEFF